MRNRVNVQRVREDMVSFKDWILSEGRLVLSTSPGLEANRDEAERGLLAYLDRYGGVEGRAAAARYEYTLTNVREDWNDTAYCFSYKPIETNRRGRDEVVAGDDERRRYYPPGWDGRTGRRVYPTPKDALADIPDDPQMGWRGMSWEEWRLSERRGFVESMGGHNFSNQGGLTFYGYRPDTGTSYASGFAPAAFKATPKKPGVVIAVPRRDLLDHTQNPGVPAGELAHLGPLPLSHVAYVYMLVPTQSRPGTVEVIVSHQGKVSEGSRGDVSIGYAIRRLR